MAGLAAGLLLAGCEDDARAAIDAVVTEPPPGLGVRLDRVRLVVERLEGDGRFHDRVPSYAEGARIEPIGIHVTPERAEDPGRVLYRLSAEGLSGDTKVVEQRHRLVFVPGRTLTLPFRFDAACAGVECASGTTCVGGSCADDYVPACSLQGAVGSAYCRGMDGGAPDSGTMGARDAGVADAGPIDAGSPGDCVCRIEGVCYARDDREPGNECMICNPSRDASGWSVAVDYPCEDGMYCTAGERCDASGACVWATGDRIACLDGNQCTEDVCDESLRACRNPQLSDGTTCYPGGPIGHCCRGTCVPMGSTCS